MILVFAFITLIYVSLIYLLIIGFDLVKESNNNIILSEKSDFSIIVPFRNEEKNLKNLVNSLQSIDYASEKFEVIFVNDESEDDSIETLHNCLANSSLEYTIINNERKSNSPKKDAIESAIKIAKFDWIITTDADCKVPKRWLKSIDSCIQNKQPNMIVAPVVYLSSNSLLSSFQLLDNLSLQASTIGGFGIKQPFLCNGANLVYSKQQFITVNGFNGNADYASGDDMFLFQKFIKQNKKDVHVLKSKNAIVTTLPEENWKNLLNQRIRWVSKSKAYKTATPTILGLIIFTMNLLCILSIILFSLGKTSLNIPITVILSKLIVDYFLLKKSSQFFNKKISIFNFLICSFIYPFFSAYVVLKSLQGKYYWKNRWIKK